MGSISTFRSLVAELYSGHTQSEVGEILGVPQWRISRIMRHFGIPTRAPKTPAPKGIVAQALTRRGRTTNRTAREMFLNMYRTRRMSLFDIATEIGASEESVRSFAVSRGISLRPQGQHA